MEQTAGYGTIPLAAFLTTSRNLTIPVEYVKGDDGSWSCWSKTDCYGLTQTYGFGKTFDEAVDDYIDALKEIAESIYQDNVPDINTSPEYLVKFLGSSREELKRCLNGKISEDS